MKLCWNEQDLLRRSVTRAFTGGKEEGTGIFPDGRASNPARPISTRRIPGLDITAENRLNASKPAAAGNARNWVISLPAVAGLLIPDFVHVFTMPNRRTGRTSHSRSS